MITERVVFNKQGKITGKSISDYLSLLLQNSKNYTKKRTDMHIIHIPKFTIRMIYPMRKNNSMV